MAETVRLRNITDTDLEVGPLNGRVVGADCVVEIPARLLHHQRVCNGTVRWFDAEAGTWPERPCGGCLMWPEETWRVESEPKPAPTTAKTDRKTTVKE